MKTITVVNMNFLVPNQEN